MVFQEHDMKRSTNMMMAARVAGGPRAGGAAAGALRRALAGAGVLAAALFVSGCGSSDAAPVPPVPTTAILVHGAWADGSSWAKVTPLLQQRGINVVSVQLQRATLAGDAAVVQRAIAAQTGQVILVGHSYGGEVITEAGNDAKVVSLVYVDAFAPGDGESISDLISPYPAGAWQAGLIKDSGGYLTLSKDVYLNNFAADVPTADAAVMASSQGPITAQALLLDKVNNAAWKTRPSYFVMGTSDQIIPLAFQQGEAARIKAKAVPIAGASHVPMVSHPTEVANAIIDAAVGVNGVAQ
jgi:pimeloyl-ACP methyl ester carboxylesterase